MAGGAEHAGISGGRIDSDDQRRTDCEILIGQAEPGAGETEVPLAGHGAFRKGGGFHAGRDFRKTGGEADRVRAVLPDDLRHGIPEQDAGAGAGDRVRSGRHRVRGNENHPSAESAGRASAGQG